MPKEKKEAFFAVALEAPRTSIEELKPYWAAKMAHFNITEALADGIDEACIFPPSHCLCSH